MLINTVGRIEQLWVEHESALTPTTTHASGSVVPPAHGVVLGEDSGGKRRKVVDHALNSINVHKYLKAVSRKSVTCVETLKEQICGFFTDKSIRTNVLLKLPSTSV